MLEALDLGKKLSKAEYKRLLPKYQQRIHRLQRACYEAQLATLVVFEGWDAAGKGTAIRKLTQRLEPRGFRLHDIREPRTFETQLPWMWRFWKRLPNWGEMAIFDRSWYGRVLVERVEKLVTGKEARKSLRDIAAFERTLADDRYVIVKFFLHIDRKTQKERFERLEADETTAWQVQPEDWQHHEAWDDYLAAVEKMLEHTESEWGPWTLVEATDRRWARAKVFKTLIDSMEKGLARLGHPVPEPFEPPPEDEENDEEVDGG